MALINNNESKAKLFALYYGQRVLKWHDNSPIFSVDFEGIYDHKSQSTNIDFSKHHLSLFDISSLSDEQAKELGILLGFKRNESRRCIEKARNFCDSINSGSMHGWGGMQVIVGYQYLISQSIALPFYCSIEKRVISVGEQCELGFIKIRTI